MARSLCSNLADCYREDPVDRVPFFDDDDRVQRCSRGFVVGSVEFFCFSQQRLFSDGIGLQLGVFFR